MDARKDISAAEMVIRMDVEELSIYVWLNELEGTICVSKFYSRYYIEAADALFCVWTIHSSSCISPLLLFFIILSLMGKKAARWYCTKRLKNTGRHKHQYRAGLVLGRVDLPVDKAFYDFVEKQSNSGHDTVILCMQ